MDLVEFLQQLTDKGVGLAGTHPEVGVYYELQLRHLSGPLTGGKQYLQVKWTKEPQSFGGRMPPYEVYSSLDVIEGMTFEEVHTEAMAVIGRWWKWWHNFSESS